MNLQLTILTIFPDLFLGISIICLLFHCLFFKSKQTNNFFIFDKSILSLFRLIVLILLVLLLNCNCFDLNSDSVVSDISCNNLKIVITFVSIFFFFVVGDFTDIKKVYTFEFYLIVLCGLLGTFLICSSNDLLMVYLSIELQGLSFCLLSSFNKRSQCSSNAGFKYFILGSFSSGLFLYGCSVLYGLFGTLIFTDLCSIIQVSGGIHIVLYPLFLIFISLLFKLGIAPFHAWLPDVYEGAPFNSSFFFAIVPKLSIFIIFLRIFNFSVFNTSFYLAYVWGIFTIFSVIVGSIAGAEVRQFRSLFGYNSSSYMGYTSLFLTVSENEGPDFALQYLFIDLLTALGFWIILMLLVEKNNYPEKQSSDLTDIVLLYKTNPGLASIVIIIFISTANVPPIINFLMKLLLFSVGIEVFCVIIFLFILFCGTVTTYYFIRILKITYSESVFVGKLYYPIKRQSVIILVFLAFLLVFLFVEPDLLDSFISTICWVYYDKHF